MSVEHDGVGGLSRGHVVRRLLELDHLLVVEDGLVVDERHAVQRLTSGADCRLSNPPTVNLHALSVTTYITTKKRWRREKKIVICSHRPHP